MHALTTYHWVLTGRSNRCKEGTAQRSEAVPHSPTFFNGDVNLPGLFFNPDYYYF